MSQTYVIGDVHGQYEKLVALLQRSGLIGTDKEWTGGTNSVWFMGDFVDRGPDGISVIDLVMRLGQDAPRDGGKVRALIGNHEPLLLAAHFVGNQSAGGPGGTFMSDWERNGGVPSDLDRLRPHHIEWLINLPAIAQVNGNLLMHADALFYTKYGGTVAQVNKSFRSLLASSDAEDWDRLLGQFSERDAFRGPDGAARARHLLQTFGGTRLIHGHTPIARWTKQPPAEVREAFDYADGLCVNVDPGMMLGGEGFLYQLSTD